MLFFFQTPLLDTSGPSEGSSRRITGRVWGPIYRKEKNKICIMVKTRTEARPWIQLSAEAAFRASGLVGGKCVSWLRSETWLKSAEKAAFYFINWCCVQALQEIRFTIAKKKKKKLKGTESHKCQYFFFLCLKKKKKKAFSGCVPFVVATRKFGLLNCSRGLKVRLPTEKVQHFCSFGGKLLRVRLKSVLLYMESWCSDQTAYLFKSIAQIIWPILTNPQVCKEP